MCRTLDFGENEQSHKCHGDTLGQLQGGIDNGSVNAEKKVGNHAPYRGDEIYAKFPEAKEQGKTFLKADCTGSGKTPNGRSKNRVVVAVKDGKVIDGEAYLWRHDNRVEKLGPGFFKRGAMLRQFTSKKK